MTVDAVSVVCTRGEQKNARACHIVRMAVEFVCIALFCLYKLMLVNWWRRKEHLVRFEGLVALILKI